jgi:Ca2+-transporting ATPase
LTSAEAKSRLEKYGPNELKKEEPTPLWRMVVDQFADLIVGLLCMAALVSLALGELAEGIGTLHY